MRSRLFILRHLKIRLREGLKHLSQIKRWKITTRSITFLCSKSPWRRGYLECIKIIADQAPLSLGLAHNKRNGVFPIVLWSFHMCHFVKKIKRGRKATY
ncbi:unnamed protein product [Spirodela intermedia]|uniref:Uncharacterized protein n=1 Tax=Spirodela intermedia TaxID=51605 RepID=A0A7I8JF92_SPIIN|nr:unnamed protein product [Spirodela intermedia]CAA6668848.1 unnamed protein product [Spirodela intermedia]